MNTEYNLIALARVIGNLLAFVNHPNPSSLTDDWLASMRESIHEAVSNARGTTHDDVVREAERRALGMAALLHSHPDPEDWRRGEYRDKKDRLAAIEEQLRELARRPKDSVPPPAPAANPANKREDTSVDTKKKKEIRPPRDKAVLRLGKILEKERGSGRPESERALEFADGDPKQAARLLKAWRRWKDRKDRR